NQGVMNVQNGGRLAFSRTWTNAGGVFQVHGGSFLLGSTFTPDVVGTIDYTSGATLLTGTLSNTGTTLALSASTGPWTLAGGAVSGGTVNMSGGATLIMSNNSNNRLTAVTVNGNLDLSGDNSWLRVRDGLTLNGTASIGGTSSRIVFDNTQTVMAG